MNPSTSVSERPVHARGRLALARDCWQLVRPRIAATVLFTMIVAALVAGETIPPWPLLVHAVVGVGLLIVGAIALNQRLERCSDAKMARTAWRPLASGRLTDRRAVIFGLLTSAAGLCHLALWVNVEVVVLAAVSWVIYVWVYTPLKMVTAWQTPIGAVAGAMPTLLGAALAGATLSSIALSLFGIAYFWQFPHAMAIAWLYRDQFAEADLKVATVVDPSGRLAARIAVLGAVMLLPVSLLPSLTGRAGWFYCPYTAALALGYLGCSVQFLLSPSDKTARRLLRFSFVHLPAVLLGLLTASLW